jgi:hypothetical protein
MSGNLLEGLQGPKTQSIDAVKALLSWRGRGTDPMPATVEFTQGGEEGRLVLVLAPIPIAAHRPLKRECKNPPFLDF